MMGALADIKVAVLEILSYIRARTMKRKKRKKSLLTPEERQGYEERLESLLRMYERAKIELATGKRPPAEPS
jgi:hypothetical protein